MSGTDSWSHADTGQTTRHRVIVAAHGYPPTFGAGAERRAERTALALRVRGHQVAVLCVESGSNSGGSPRWDDSLQDGVLVRRLFFDASAGADSCRVSYDNPFVGAALRDLIGSWRPSLLHLFSGYLLSSSVLAVARSAGLPAIVTLTDYWWICHRVNLIRSDGSRCDGPSLAACTRCRAETKRRFRLPSQLFPRLTNLSWQLVETVPALANLLGRRRQAERSDVLRQTLNQADAVITPSQYLADLHLRAGAKPRRLQVWRQGVDLRGLLPREPSRTLRVGYIGQVKSHKGVDLLLEAWTRLRGDRPRRLVLYGSDHGEEAYGRRVRAMIAAQPDVEWRGRFDADQLWRVLSKLDVVVVPSRWAENSPNSILEAQAAQLPVVGSDLGGVAELIEHGYNGLRFRVDDAVDLAHQLQRLLDEPGLLDQLSEGALKVRSMDDEVDQLVGLYNELSGIRVPC